MASTGLRVSESADSRSLYFVAKRRVEIRREGVETGPGQTLLSSRLIGISHGTELLIYRGEAPADLPADEVLTAVGGSLAYPLKYGYMNVAATASGERYFVFHPHQDRFACDLTEAVPLPDAIETEDAVFLANMETALGVVQDARPVAGDSILIIGQGVVGMLVAELLCRFGMERVVSVDPIEKRRELSASMGCLTVDPALSDSCGLIRELTGGRGPDIAINTSGSAAGLQLAIDVTAFEGLILEASWFGTRDVLLNLGTSFHRRRLTIRSSQVSNISPRLGPRWTKERRLSRALDYVGRMRPSRLISHRIPFSKAPEAYRLICDHPEEVLQVVLDPTA